jgi:hypothetical protein
MGNKLTLAAFVIALVSLLLHAVLDRHERESFAAVGVELQLQSLESRVGALELENSQLRRSLADAQSLREVVTERPALGADSEPLLDDLAERLTELERHAAEQQAATGQDQIPSRPPERALERPSIDEMLARARDRALTEEERLDALRALRGQRLPDGSDARLPVLDEMLELARLSQNGEARANVWRHLSNVTDRRVLGPLLDALAYDSHARSREEAAEDLADFMPDAAVEAALRTAAEHDVDGRVRRQAVKSLAGGD